MKNGAGVGGSPNWKLKVLISLAAAIGVFFLASHLPSRAQLRTAAPGTFKTFDGSHYDYAAPAKDQHAFMLEKLKDRTSGYYTTDLTPEWRTNATLKDELSTTPSQYASQIAEDLASWPARSVTPDLLEAGQQYSDVCGAEVARVQILSGSVWVERFEAPGLEDARSLRLSSMLLNLLDVASTFPGSVPDLDMVLTSAESPCVRAKWAHGATPVPLFGRTGSRRHRDVPLPESDLWLPGTERRVLSPFGEPIVGWERTFELIRSKYAGVPLTARAPQVVWRGPWGAPAHPEKDALRGAFVGCAPALVRTGRAPEAALLNAGPSPAVDLASVCDFRYVAHLEGLAAPDDLRLKLACNSVVIAAEPEYWEYWAKSLVPGKTHVNVTNFHDHVCNRTVAAVTDMNAVVGTVGTQALKDSGSGATPSLRALDQALRADPAYAPAVRSGLEDDAPVPLPSGNYSWGSTDLPWDIAWAGQRHVATKARPVDALLYTRDVLAAYAPALALKPTPGKKARCLTGARLLEAIAAVDRAEAAGLARAQPWLKDLDNGCQGSEATYKENRRS